MGAGVCCSCVFVCHVDNGVMHNAVAGKVQTHTQASHQGSQLFFSHKQTAAKQLCGDISP